MRARPAVGKSDACAKHHSSRGQRKARTGKGEREVYYTAEFGLNPPPHGAHIGVLAEPGVCRRLLLPFSAAAATMGSTPLLFGSSWLRRWRILGEREREQEEVEKKKEAAKLAWACQPRSPEYNALLDKLTSRHLSAADKANVLARLSELKGRSGAGPSSSSSGERRKRKKKREKRRRKWTTWRT